MAKGRFISKTLGRSHKFNQLPTHFAKLVYVLTLTHADEAGRIEAEAVDIYADNFVRDPQASPDTVEEALHQLHDVGLIHLYEINGKRYAEFADFHEHNQIRRDADGKPTREGRTQVPDPPSDRAPTAQQPRSDRAVTASQDKGKDKVQVEVLSKDMSPAGDDLECLVEAWNTNRGRLPAAHKLNSARAARLRTLVRDLGGTDQAYAAITIAAQEVSRDDFWIRKQYGFDNLLANQKVIQKAETAYNRGSFDPDQAEIDRMLAALGGNDA